LGNTTPDWNGSLATDFRYHGLTLSLLLDAAVGFDLQNNPRQRAVQAFTAGETDQFGKPEGHKKPNLYYTTLYSINDVNSHFIEDGSWLKVREVSLGYTLPETWLQHAFKGRVERITLSVIGRNLFTLTDYSGYDPEVGFALSDLGSASIARWDDFQYPNFRTVTASLVIVF
jgi:hypothetical protein